ncbi:AMP-binding protein [Actinosynnema sp. NPDC023658]|uniref:AMP-binding protein n=1 Tax=Actinosynnema sp. NPDC023658 TaxID=3155465 RepID=UPI0033CB88C2
MTDLAAHTPEAAVDSLVEVLRGNAERAPGSTALRFLPPGHAPGERGEVLSRGELDLRARAVAAALQREGAAGARVLVLLPSGPEFLVGFVGCLYAGAVAVPCSPDFAKTAPGATDRFVDVAEDAGATAVLTLAELAPALRDRWGSDRTPPGTWIDVDALDEDDARLWTPPRTADDDVALLQYTSGSTGRPKGVAVTIGNLGAQLANFRALSELPAGGNVVCWMSPLHALGLGQVLLAQVVGGEAVLMTPEDFVADPFRWLAAISATPGPVLSAAPNFAYERCAASIGEEQRAALDLSGWEVALIGGERVQAPTLERFVAAFGPVGFRRSSLFPAYGLTETMQIVVGRRRPDPLGVVVDAAELELGRAQPVSSGDAERTQELVGCGGAGPFGRVLVVDAGSRVECAAGRVGEVWVSGPVVCQGYWNRPAETAETFTGVLADGDGPFVRTGDLAFFHDGDLVLCGRLKELIIIRGRNLHPQDVEGTVQQVEPALSSLPVAAFSVDSDEGERLVVVQAVEPGGALGDPVALAERIRLGVASAHQVEVHEVVLVEPSAVPRTQSGKIQRRSCRDAYLDGSLTPLATSADVAQADAIGSRSTVSGLLLALPPEVRAAAVAAELRGRIAGVLGVSPDALPEDKSLIASGMDSMRMIKLRQDLERDYGVTVPMSEFPRATVHDLGLAILRGVDGPTG